MLNDEEDKERSRAIQRPSVELSAQRTSSTIQLLDASEYKVNCWLNASEDSWTQTEAMDAR